MSISRVLAALVVVTSGTVVAAADDPIPGNPLIEIPAGPFVFGNDSGEDNERPRRVIEGRAFAINRTEITNAQYQRFVDATAHRSAFYGGHPSLGSTTGRSWRQLRRWPRSAPISACDPTERIWARRAAPTARVFPGAARPSMRRAQITAATPAATATTATAMP